MLPPPLPQALLHASAQAFLRLLLDGGPCRLFIPADVMHLESDLRRLRALFYADGDGVDRDTIDAELKTIMQVGHWAGGATAVVGLQLW
jgi:hypothetical protein